MNLKSNEVVREEFIEFEDEAQKGIVYIGVSPDFRGFTTIRNLINAG